MALLASLLTLLIFLCTTGTTSAQPLEAASLSAFPESAEDDSPSWKGIRVGSRVVRGPSWAYGEQDGGHGGGGTVLELRPWRRAGEDGALQPGVIAARVLWDDTGAVNAYRWDAPNTGGARDLQLVGWRPLSTAEAALAPSYAQAAERAEALERSSAALAPALLGLWEGLGGAQWTSQRGWREAAQLGTGGRRAAQFLELLPCGSGSGGSSSGWEGVACTLDHSSLLGLDLSGNSLRGVLTAAMLEALPPGLQSLSLARNALAGQLPDALCRFQGLRFLDLSFNRLAGPLPACLGDLPHLEVLNLASNALAGELPPLWARLRSLQALHLQGNEQLQGVLPQPLREWLASLPHKSLPLKLRQ
jgi:hypothetical protein